MDKIMRDGTSTQFDEGYSEGILKVFNKIKSEGIQSYTNKGNLTFEFEKLEKELNQKDQEKGG